MEFRYNWQISWQRFLDQKLTDDSLGKWFDVNKRQFDGTELRVAHLLLKFDDSANELAELSAENELAKRKNDATILKTKIESGDLTWDQAVRQHSDAPTNETGGEIGWIKIAGSMPDSFTNAAFDLETDQISPPVQTAFGIHLIRCLEIKEGKTGWKDAEQAVRRHATFHLFETIADKHRPSVKIEYSDSSSVGENEGKRK